MKNWIEAYADHVRKRFNSRVALRARIDGAEPLDVCQLYVLEGGGLVLKAWCGHDDACTGDHEHAGEAPHAAPHAGDEHHGDGHAHEPGDAHHCEYEVWVSSHERVVFEARPVEDGKLCTGFGYLGVSRTPHVLVPRGTHPPAKPAHEHREF